MKSPRTRPTGHWHYSLKVLEVDKEVDEEVDEEVDKEVDEEVDKEVDEEADEEADMEVALMAQHSTGPRTRPTGHWHRQLNRFRT